MTQMPIEVVSVEPWNVEVLVDGVLLEFRNVPKKGFWCVSRTSHTKKDTFLPKTRFNAARNVALDASLQARRESKQNLGQLRRKIG